MREILFRGKDIKENWHTGLLAHIGNAWYISNKAGVATAYEIIPSTIGQYTGLTDKNGVKIFEGDVVKSYHFSEAYGEGVVRWERDLMGFYYDGYKSMSPIETYEVIGNIFDNHELMKGGVADD